MDFGVCVAMTVFGQQVEVSTRETISGNSTLHGLTSVWFLRCCNHLGNTVCVVTKSTSCFALLHTFHSLPFPLRMSCTLVGTCSLSISPCFRKITEPCFWTCRRIPLTTAAFISHYTCRKTYTFTYCAYRGPGFKELIQYVLWINNMRLTGA